MKQEETNKIISLDEERMDSKREEELKASIKQQEVSVPDSLRPEQIKKRLEGMQTRDYENRKRAFSNKRISRVFTGVAAGIVLIAGAMAGGSVLFHQNQKKDEGNSYSQAAASNQDSQSKTDNDTYAKAYEVLEQYYQYYYGGVDESGNILSDIINGVADTFGSRKYNYYDAAASKDDIAMEESTGASMDSADGAGTFGEKDSASTDYSENNVRTNGVEECNIVRTDGRYIYEYDENSSYIHIYNAQAADTSLAGEINLNEYQLEVSDGFYVSDGILAISGSAIEYSSEDGDKALTRTLLYDVKNPEKPKFLKGFSQDGMYEESRMVGDMVYVFSSYTVSVQKLKEIKQERPQSYIPKFEDELVSEEDLYVQPDCYLDSYTMISSINTAECTYIDKKTILGGVGKRYVSASHIYLLDMDYTEDAEIRFLRFTYEDGEITDKTNGRMKGEINDDYSIDEYQGYLRMVTHYYDENARDYVNGLFIYDEKLRQKGSVKGIAKGEEIKSARFIGDTAYFVTYRNTDPLFAVDVSNPEKPKVLGYLKIPGFSAYLHPYEDNLLFGLGLETDENSMVLGLKLSMYDISDSSDIKEIDKLVLDKYQDSEVLYDANALLIDPEKNLIGFGAEGENYNDITGAYACSRDYLVYSYDKKQGFLRRLKQGNDSQDYYEMKNRGLYIDNYFYVVTVGQDIKAYKMGENSFKLVEKGEEEKDGRLLSKELSESLISISYKGDDEAEHILVDEERIKQFVSLIEKESYQECQNLKLSEDGKWEEYDLRTKDRTIISFRIKGEYVQFDGILYRAEDDISSKLAKVFGNKN